MTTNQQMTMAYTAQQEVITALSNIDETDLADRLERCMNARRERHYGSGWPRTCRSAACVWCRRSMIRGWWNGMCRWSAASSTTSSVAIIQLDLSAGLHDAVRRLRRGLRDVRDRMARRRRRWRAVSLAGMAGGDGTALVVISHDDVGRGELLDALRRRWPDVVVKNLEQEMPAAAMAAKNAAELGQCRRGVEPLRIVIMPQHDLSAAAAAPPPVMEPMPVLV